MSSPDGSSWGRVRPLPACETVRPWTSRAHDRSERRRALHGGVRRPRRPGHPPRHGHRRVDALVGGGLLPAARRRRPVRDPLRPPRHRPIGHVRAGAPAVHRRRPGRRRRRRARRVRDPGRARRRRLGRRRVRAAARARLPRSRPLARPHQHVARDAGRAGLPRPRSVSAVRATASVDWSDKGR